MKLSSLSRYKNNSKNNSCKKNLFLSLFTIFILSVFLLPFCSAYGVTFYNPEWNPQYGMVFDSIQPNTEYTIEGIDKAVAITKIVFSINREAQNGGITVYNLRTVPDFLPEVADGELYEINELKYSGFVPHDTTKLVYEFRVSKSFLENSTFNRNDIVLHAFRRTLGTWEALDTRIIREDDEHIFYTASDIGVHYLLIGKEQDGSSSMFEEPIEDTVEVVSESSSDIIVESADDIQGIEVKKEDPIIETKEIDNSPIKEIVSHDPTSVVVEDNIVVQEEPIQDNVEVVSSPVPSAAPEQNAQKITKPKENVDEENDIYAKTLGALFLLALVIVVSVLYFVFYQQKPTSVEKELHNYIKESLKRGKTHEQVEKRLLDVGWHPDRVKHALKKHKHNKTTKKKK